MIHAMTITRPNIMICSEAAIKSHFSTFNTLSYIKKVIQIDGTPTEKGVLAYR